MFRIGCDVGGTNTDAAIIDVTRLRDVSRGVLATAKTATTQNVTDGITSAIEKVLVASEVQRDQVLNVAIGTTHFVNAVVENDRRHLQRVAVIRLCGPYTRSNTPFSDYPYALRDSIEGPVFYLDGGLEVDGREIKALDEDQIREATKTITGAGINAVAVVGIFSALDHEGRHEERCRRIMLDINPKLSVVCSHTIGGTSYLVRENVTILNATILELAQRTIYGFQMAMSKLGLACPLYLTQNDGTLIEATQAARLPVKTFASGPTNSLIGAAFLQDISSKDIGHDKQLLVVDVGGTTTDVCALLPSGFPRKAPNFVEVGGVRTAFSMPEVYSIGLGGGSHVRLKQGNLVTVGPDSVAYRLTTEAKVFGGQTLTATDIAVASGLTSLGNVDFVNDEDKTTITAGRMEICRMLEGAIDKMKVSSAPAIVILVGGGSIIVGNELRGVEQCLRPPHHDSANAVGAAIAGVSGEIDTIVVLENEDENKVIEQIKKQLIVAAVENGADERTVRISEITKIPLQYVSNNATRFTVKAVGDLDPKLKLSSPVLEISIPDTSADKLPSIYTSALKKNLSAPLRKGSMATPCSETELTSYTPSIREGIWYISPVDVELIASGCGILGTGGGGSSYNMALYVQRLLQQEGAQGKIRVIAPSFLKDDQLCVFGSGYGAPSVSDERLSSGVEIFNAVQELNTSLNINDFHAIVADEIGGGNGLITFPSSLHFDKPVVDCDLMGRAYPTAEHLTPCVYGHPLTPCSMADCSGNVSIVMKAANNRMVESMLRTQCIVLGNSAAVASRPLSGKVIKEYAVPNTVSQAWFLGRAVHLARGSKMDFIEALQDIMPVKLLYTGKIIDVARDVSRGYTVGKCVIAPLSTDEQEDKTRSIQHETRSMIVPFQNEYLAAYLVNDREIHDTQAEKDILCTVPDLISIIGQDGEALGSPDLRYGLQVKVIGMPAHPLWTGTPEGLKIGRPEFFQLGMEWKPIGEYKLPKSVFDVFGNNSS